MRFHKGFGPIVNSAAPHRHLHHCQFFKKSRSLQYQIFYMHSHWTWKLKYGTTIDLSFDAYFIRKKVRFWWYNYLFCLRFGLIVFLTTTNIWYFVSKIVLIIYSNSKMSDQFFKVRFFCQNYEEDYFKFLWPSQKPELWQNTFFNMFLEVPIWSNRLEQLKSQLEQIITRTGKKQHFFIRPKFGVLIMNYKIRWIVHKLKTSNVIYGYKSCLSLVSVFALYHLRWNFRFSFKCQNNSLAKF
jgi:hypothetical protein